MEDPTSKKKSRRRRGDKPAARAATLSKHDFDTLELIGRGRLVRGDLIDVVQFPESTTRARRMARLAAAGLVRTHVESLSTPNYYSLSERGLRMLVAEGVDADSLHVGRFVRGESLEHLRLLNELYGSVLIACRARSDLRLDTWLFDHDLRRVAGAKVPGYIPDALLRLVDGESCEHSFVFEVDLGGERLKVLSEKARTTLAIQREGLPLWGLDRWRPIVVAPSVARLRGIAGAMVEVGAGDLWLGTDVARLAEHGVLGPAYLLARDIAAVPRGTNLPEGRPLLDAWEAL